MTYYFGKICNCERLYIVKAENRFRAMSEVFKRVNFDYPNNNYHKTDIDIQTLDKKLGADNIMWIKGE